MEDRRTRFFFPLLLSIPVLTSYSVLVDHVLDVRLIIRKAVQYVLARSLLVAAASTPALLLILRIQAEDQTTQPTFPIPTLYGGAPRSFSAWLCFGIGTPYLTPWIADSFASTMMRDRFLPALPTSAKEPLISRK